MDGLEVLTKMKACCESAGLELPHSAILTGDATVGSKVGNLANFFFTKPITRGQLKEVLAPLVKERIAMRSRRVLNFESNAHGNSSVSGSDVSQDVCGTLPSRQSSGHRSF